MSMATRCSTYVVHLSTQLGLERIKQAQAQGQAVWTETCPQYLLLTDTEMAKYGPLAKIGLRCARKTGRTGTHCGEDWSKGTFP
jgi:dihydroorotase-like cyclic amidohydrolase